MSTKKEITKQIKSTMNELNKLINQRNELEKRIQQQEKECFGILNKALGDLEDEFFS